MVLAKRVIAEVRECTRQETLTKKIVTKEVIENQQVHTPYLMELILDKKINTDRKFKSEELQSDPSKLSKIFLNENNYDFLKVFIHINY